MKGCIFDLDGTLTDTLESLTYSVNLTLQEMGLPLISRDQCRRFVGDGARKLLERTLKACGDAHLVRLEEAVQVYGRIFHDNCTYHVTPYDGIPEMLRELKEKGIRLAVLSNKPHAQAVDVVRKSSATASLTWCRGRRRSSRESRTRRAFCTCWTRWESGRRTACMWGTPRWMWPQPGRPV